MKTLVLSALVVLAATLAVQAAPEESQVPALLLDEAPAASCPAESAAAFLLPDPLPQAPCERCSDSGATKWEPDGCCTKPSQSFQRYREFVCDGECWLYTATTKCEDACELQ